MGDERAETYLTRLAEAELRRAGAELRRLDTATEDLRADPGLTPYAIAEGAAWKVGRAGWILVAAGVLDQDYLHDLAAELGAAIKVRSRLLLNRDRQRAAGVLAAADAAARPGPGRGRGRGRGDGTRHAGPRHAGPVASGPVRRT